MSWYFADLVSFSADVNSPLKQNIWSREEIETARSPHADRCWGGHISLFRTLVCDGSNIASFLPAGILS